MSIADLTATFLFSVSLLFAGGVVAFAAHVLWTTRRPS